MRWVWRWYRIWCVFVDEIGVREIGNGVLVISGGGGAW
jgi:hypothetical protein